MDGCFCCIHRRPPPIAFQREIQRGERQAGDKGGLCVFTVRASSFNRCERGRSDVFTRLFPREIVVCSSFALRGDDEWGEGGVEGGIANGIEGFTAIMAISRVDTFLFFFCFFFLPILTPDRRIFEIYWRYGTKKRGGRCY